MLAEWLSAGQPLPASSLWRAKPWRVPPITGASTPLTYHTPMVPSYDPENTLPAATASTRTASSCPSHFLCT